MLSHVWVINTLLLYYFKNLFWFTCTSTWDKHDESFQHTCSSSAKVHREQQNSAFSSIPRRKYSGEGITAAHHPWSNTSKSEEETRRSVFSIYPALHSARGPELLLIIIEFLQEEHKDWDLPPPHLLSWTPVNVKTLNMKIQISSQVLYLLLPEMICFFGNG